MIQHDGGRSEGLFGSSAFSRMVVDVMAVQVLDSGYRPSELMVVDEVVIERGYLGRRSLLIVELIMVPKKTIQMQTCKLGSYAHKFLTN